MNRDIEKISFLIFHIGRIMKEKSVKNGQHNILLHARLLEFINTKKNPTMKDISEFLCIKSPSATAIVNPLVKSAKVKRVSDKIDSRVVRLVLTSSGKKTLLIYRKKVGPVMKDNIKKLNLKERKELIKILEKLI